MFISRNQFYFVVLLLLSEFLNNTFILWTCSKRLITGHFTVVSAEKVSQYLTVFCTCVVSGSKLMDPCEVNLCRHKRHRCEVQNGTATCVCNAACTLEYDPVCASNNNTYPNLCGMEVAACESGERLRVVRPGRCGKFYWCIQSSCPRTQRIVPARSRTQAAGRGVQSTDLEATAPPRFFPVDINWFLCYLNCLGILNFSFLVDAFVSDLKPHICPAPWKGLNRICDRRGDSCTKNEDCREVGGKCCFNGCQKDCVQFGRSMQMSFSFLCEKCFSRMLIRLLKLYHKDSASCSWRKILTITSCANIFSAIEWNSKYFRT